MGTIVTVVALAATLTVAHAATLPMQVSTLFAYSEPVEVDPSPLLVDGFGTPDAGQPLGAPFTILAGSFSWSPDGSGVEKSGGQAPGDNIAVVDVGSGDVVISATIADLGDGPKGGDPTLVGLTVLSNGSGEHLLVTYRKQTGTLSVDGAVGGELAATTITAGLGSLDPLRVELRLSDPTRSDLTVWVGPGTTPAISIPVLPAVYAGNTAHGIYVARDGDAIFTSFRIGALP